MRMRVPDDDRDIITLCKRKGKYFWEFYTKYLILTDTVLDIIHELEQENIGHDGSHEYESACKDFRAAVEALRGCEQE